MTTKKNLLLGLLRTIEHPDDTTNDIILGLESLLIHMTDIEESQVYTVESILMMAMKMTQEGNYQEQYQKTQQLLDYIKQREEEDIATIDIALDQQLLSL